MTGGSKEANIQQGRLSGIDDLVLTRVEAVQSVLVQVPEDKN